MSEISIEIHSPPRRRSGRATRPSLPIAQQEPDINSDDALVPSEPEEEPVKKGKSKKRTSGTTRAAPKAKKPKQDKDKLSAGLIVRPRSASVESTVSNASKTSKQGEKKTTYAPRKPARPRAADPPTVSLVPTGLSYDNVIQLLHLREFIVRFASLLCPGTITTESGSSRSGRTRVATRSAGWPGWLLACCNELFTLLGDEELCCRLLEALYGFVQRENKANGRCLASGAAREVLERLLEELEEAKAYTHESWRCWNTVEELLVLEECLGPTKAKPDQALSSDLSDLDESQPVTNGSSPRKNRSPPLASKKVELISATLNLILSGSDSVKTAMAEGLEKEREARLKMYKIRREFTESKSGLNSEKPPGTPSKRISWQAEVDVKTSEFQNAVADNYPELHSQKIRSTTSTVLGREYFLPSPTVNHEQYPTGDEGAIFSSWSILFYGTFPAPTAGFGTANPPRKSKSRASPPPRSAHDKDETGPLVLKVAVKTEEKPQWYAISGADELQNLASYLEGQVRLRVYQRKLDAYEKDNRKKEKDGNVSSELSGLEQDYSMKEAEEKEALEYVKEVKAFADFVAAREDAGEEEEEE